MYKFEVLSGSFYKDKIRYFVGDEVESERRLDLIFKNHFKLIEEIKDEVIEKVHPITKPTAKKPAIKRTRKPKVAK